MAMMNYTMAELFIVADISPTLDWANYIAVAHTRGYQARILDNDDDGFGSEYETVRDLLLPMLLLVRDSDNLQRVVVAVASGGGNVLQLLIDQWAVLEDSTRDELARRAETLKAAALTPGMRSFIRR